MKKIMETQSKKAYVEKTTPKYEVLPNDLLLCLCQLTETKERERERESE